MPYEQITPTPDMCEALVNIQRMSDLVAEVVMPEVHSKVYQTWAHCILLDNTQKTVNAFYLVAFHVLAWVRMAAIQWRMALLVL